MTIITVPNPRPVTPYAGSRGEGHIVHRGDPTMAFRQSVGDDRRTRHLCLLVRHDPRLVHLDLAVIGRWIEFCIRLRDEFGGMAGADVLIDRRGQ